MTHVNAKGINVSNPLDMIQEVEGNTLLDFLSGLHYVVDELVVVRKDGAGLIVEADPYGWIGVALTPLDDELQLLGQMCVSYEAVVGSYDPMTDGKRSHRSAATQVIEAYRLRNCLNGLDIEWRARGRFGVTISASSFHRANFEKSENECGEVSAKTPTGVYVFSSNGHEVSLNLWL